MRPFRAAGRETFQLKVPLVVSGRYVKRTADTTDEVTANLMADMVEVLGNRHVWDVLGRVTADAPTLTIPALYNMWNATPWRANGRTGRPMEPSIDERIDYVQSRLDVVTLDALVTKWNGGGNLTYLRQVRAFIPEGSSMLIADFRRPAIADFLASWPGTTETKKRYRVALSMFARSLIQAELIESNPARDIFLKATRAETERARAHVLRCLTMEQAKLVCEATVDPEQRAMEALMAGSMIEFSGCERLMARDIDWKLRTVFADGKKTGYRSRHIEVTEEWAWQTFAAYARDLAPNTHVFTKRESPSLRYHKRTCKSLGLPITTLHQYRHTFAVTWIQRGAMGDMRDDKRNTAWLKNQAGHSPASGLLTTTYGVYVNAVKLSAQQEQRLGLTGLAGAPQQARPHEGPQLIAMK